MSSSDRTRGSPPPVRPELPAAPAAPPPANGQDSHGNWLDRMQRARARHAAISKNLQTWSSYKNWAEQMKDSWGDPQKK